MTRLRDWIGRFSGLPPRDILRLLFWLRSLAVVAQLATILAVHFGLGIVLPLGAMLAVPALLAALNVLTDLRLRWREAVSEAEVFAHLTVDLAALAALLFYSGGSSNPFVSLFLVPVVLSAAALAPPLAWAITVLAAAAYTVLMFYYIPLPSPPGGGAAAAFTLHVTGMWLNFIISAALMAYFVTRMTAALRERDRMLAEAREAALRQDHVVALGALAAGAAHELSTPLATIQVIGNELRSALADRPDLAGDLTALREQTLLCKEILSQLTARAGVPRSEGGAAQTLDAWLESVVRDWEAAHPGAALRVELAGPRPGPRIAVDVTLRQTLFNLLQNAQRASPASVELRCEWDAHALRCAVLDRGEGPPPEVERAPGSEVYSSRPSQGGMGVGLFLSRVTAERFGGELTLRARPDGGSRAELTLPLRRLKTGDGD